MIASLLIVDSANRLFNLSLSRHKKRDQHTNPDNVEEMPIACTVIDGPMTFVVVTISVCLSDDEAEEHHSANNMQRVDERERERHAVRLSLIHPAC